MSKSTAASCANAKENGPWHAHVFVLDAGSGSPCWWQMVHSAGLVVTQSNAKMNEIIVDANTSKTEHIHEYKIGCAMSQSV